MFPFGLAVGFVAGAASTALLAPQLLQQARPVAKAALKAAIAAMHQAQVRGAEVAEAAEDLYAEVKAELDDEAVQTGNAGPEADTAETSESAGPEAERPPSAAA
jgi:gas vesicle protein